MAEEAPQIDPAAEANKLVGRYMQDLGWAKINKNRVVNKPVAAHDKDAEMRYAEEIELAAEERFGQAVDALRNDDSVRSKSVLHEIVKLMGKRTDLSFFGKRIIGRLMEELEQDV